MSSLLFLYIYCIYYVGEIALIDPLQKRTANVIALSSVTCMTLSRSEFDQLLRGIKSALMQHSAMRQIGARRQRKENKVRLFKKRRISGFDDSNFPSETLIDGLLKRFFRFTMESLWASLYFRLWREMVLRPIKIDEYGEIANYIMQSCQNRTLAIQAIRTRACEILQQEPQRRSVNDHKLIIGLMRQKNSLKDRICKNWLSYQYSDLCRRVRFLRVEPLRKVHN